MIKNNLKKSTASSRQGGFTLIEIIVSLAIFTIVAVIAVGAFLKIIDANKKSQTLKTAINNVNFALESMTRELRVGSRYSCYNNPVQLSTITGGTAGSCGGLGGSVVYFNSSKKGTNNACDLIYAYWFDDTQKTIKKAEQADCGAIIRADDTSFIPVISKDAIIDAHSLIVTNETGSSGPQPKVFVRIKGHAGVKKQNTTYFDVQTTVSQRNQY